MFSLGIYFWFPIYIVIGVISVAISILLLEKIQKKNLQSNKNMQFNRKNVSPYLRKIPNHR